MNNRESDIGNECILSLPMGYVAFSFTTITRWKQNKISKCRALSPRNEIGTKQEHGKVDRNKESKQNEWKKGEEGGKEEGVRGRGGEREPRYEGHRVWKTTCPTREAVAARHVAERNPGRDPTTSSVIWRQLTWYDVVYAGYAVGSARVYAATDRHRDCSVRHCRHTSTRLDAVCRGTKWLRS